MHEEVAKEYRDLKNGIKTYTKAKVEVVVVLHQHVFHGTLNLYSVFMDFIIQMQIKLKFD